MEEGKQWKKTKWDGNENDGAIQRGAAIVLAGFGCGQSSLVQFGSVWPKLRLLLFYYLVIESTVILKQLF